MGKFLNPALIYPLFKFNFTSFVVFLWIFCLLIEFFKCTQKKSRQLKKHNFLGGGGDIQTPSNIKRTNIES